MAPPKKYDLDSPAFSANAYETLAQLREHDPVLCQVGTDGTTPYWFVSRFEDVEAILLDNERFVRDPTLLSTPAPLAERRAEPAFQFVDNHMLNKEGAEHRRLRRLVAKAFTPRMVEQLRPRIQEIADELLDRVEGRGQMDLVESYAYPLPIMVLGELLGIAPGDWPRLRDWTEATLQPVRGDEALARFTSQMDEFRAYLDGLFAERRARPGSDLISALLQADEQGDALTDTELYSMIVLLVVAGHITTVSLIGNAVLALLRHPDQLEALRADPGLMPSAIEEFLRYDTPSERTLARWPVEDVEIRGQQIPEGSWVVTLPSAANRDPDRFERPDELDLARAENRHLAFGRGVHYCVGAGLARVEGEIALSTLLRRIPSLRLAATEALEWRRISLVRALGALPVAWDVPAPLARQYSTRSR